MQALPTRLKQLLDFKDASPNDTFILFALAKEYEKMGELDHALKQFLHLLEVDEKYVGTYYHLGKLYEQLGQPVETFSTYKKGMAVSQRQSDQHAYNELAGAKLNLGDDEDFE